ncbi:hypothetical protein GCM10022234_35910 [Aeromicrobium panaciterrae]|uniref:hypothetical protein n=1 Tax=Aeromicrobium panaciterrae TaxID=363861 RepID=UPI0031DAE260
MESDGELDEPRRLIRPKLPPRQDLSDDVVLTQYGTQLPDGKTEFRGGPRASEHGLSLLVGRVDADAATLCVRQHLAEPYDIVRHTRVGLLRDAGFIVSHAPVEWFINHALVHVPGPDPKWDNQSKNAFKRTFVDFAEEDSHGRS